MIVGVTSYSLAIYHKDSMEREKNYLLGAGAGGRDGVFFMWSTAVLREGVQIGVRIGRLLRAP